MKQFGSCRDYKGPNLIIEKLMKNTSFLFLLHVSEIHDGLVINIDDQLLHKTGALARNCQVSPMSLDYLPNPTKLKYSSRVTWINRLV